MVAATIFPKNFVSHHTTSWSSTSTVGWYAGTRAQERWCTAPGGGGVHLGILGRGVPPGSPNPDPISDQNIPFSTTGRHSKGDCFAPHFLHSTFSTLLIFHTPHFVHSSFSTLRIFHTPHFPHSASSTLLIFYTPHSSFST